MHCSWVCCSLGAGWAFLGVVEDVLTRDALVQADLTVFTFLQQLRSAPVDRVMIAITEMGSVGVLLPLTAAVLGWLLWRRCWRTAGYWLLAAGVGELLVLAIRLSLGRHRPLDLYQGLDRFSFPIGHATVSTVVLGFLAFLLARRQPRAGDWQSQAPCPCMCFSWRFRACTSVRTGPPMWWAASASA